MKYILTTIIVLVLFLGIINGGFLKKHCSDFLTQSEALRTFEKHPIRYRSLDRDHDYKPCESLPK